MISKQPIYSNKIRKIIGSFSWIDHRILHDGYLKSMSPPEILLYFFLVLVGDKNGISYYCYDKICDLLKLNPNQFVEARNQLLNKSLIAHKNGRFQVLQLPEIKKQNHSDHIQRTHSARSLKEIFKEIS